MHSFIAFSFLAAAAFVEAQSSSSSAATPSSTSSPLIPTGISSGCSSFLQSLNSNSTVASCLTPIVNATSSFGPLSNNSTNATSSAIKSALGTLCSTSSLTSGCNDAVIRSQLSSMYSACSNELTGSSANSDVQLMYDVLYMVVPLKDAVCTKDDSGNYCLMSASSSVSSGSPSSASASVSIGGSKAFVSSTKEGYDFVENNLWSYVSGSSLSKRASSDNNSNAALIPNATTFRTSNLPFLFISSDEDSSTLCTSCTRNVLSAYITFEQSIPYALGISNSPMLGGQSDLYNNIVSECGSNFMSGAVQAAGGLSGGLVSGATARVSLGMEGRLFATAAAALLGLVSLL